MAGTRSRRCDAAVAARDAALAAFPEGMAHDAVRRSGGAGGGIRRTAADRGRARGAGAHDRRADRRESTRHCATPARPWSRHELRVEAAQAARTKAIAEHASQVGRLDALAASSATPRISPRPRTGFVMRRRVTPPLPVPERIVTEAEVATARTRRDAGEIGPRRRLSATSSGPTARSNRSAARSRASGCAMRSRRSSWRSATSGRSRRTTRRGCCCSSR